MNKKIAIILINYKDYANRFLEECRDSLLLQNYPKEFFKVYIVDNASGEESRKKIGDFFPEAKIIIRNDGNYTAGNNAGIKTAIQDGFEYFVIANMDVKFDENWLRELGEAIDSEKNIGIAQSKILLYPKDKKSFSKARINSVGNICHFLGFGFTNGYGKENRDIQGLPELRGYASGCSFIIKKEVLDKIGMYNEEYYMYHDDLEIGWKTKLAGYKIVLAPRSIVYHKYEFSRSIKMFYFMERNRYIAIFSFYKLPTLLLIFPALFFMDLGILFFSIINGWFLAKLKVYAYFLNPNSWIKIFRERKRINKFRIKKDKDVIKNFSGQVLFQEIDNPVLKYIANPIFDFYWKIIFKIINFIGL